MDSSSGDLFKLKAENYYLWSIEIEVLLRGKGVWIHVDPNCSTVASQTDETDLQRSNLALAYILMSIDRSCKSSVMKLRNPREVCNTLKRTYQSVAEAAIDAKILKLQNIQMSSKESIVAYTNRLEAPLNELLDAGNTVSRAEKRRALFTKLLKDFNEISRVIRMSDKSFTESVSHLIIEETTKEEEEETERALLSGHQSQFKNGIKCHKCGRKENLAEHCLKNKKCRHCGRKEHLSKNCWTNPNSPAYRGNDNLEKRNEK